MIKLNVLMAIAIATVARESYAQKTPKGTTFSDQAAGIFLALPKACLDDPNGQSQIFKSSVAGDQCAETASIQPTDSEFGTAEPLAIAKNGIVTYVVYTQSIISWDGTSTDLTPSMGADANPMQIASLRIRDLTSMNTDDTNNYFTNIAAYEFDAIRQTTVNTASAAGSLPAGADTSHNDNQVKIMAANTEVYAGCLGVTRGSKSIGFFERSDTLYETCTNKVETKDTITLEFSDLGLDVVTGLCHLVRSFLLSQNTNGKNLMINLDNNYLGEEGNLRLGAYSVYTSSLPSYIGPSKNKAIAGVQPGDFCARSDAWIDPTMQTSLNRIELSLQNNRFGTATTLDAEDGDALIGNGYLSPPKFDTVITNVPAADLNFGEIILCNNPRMKRLIFQNADQKTARSSKTTATLQYPKTTAAYIAQYSTKGGSTIPDAELAFIPATPFATWGANSATGKGTCDTMKITGYNDEVLPGLMAGAFGLLGIGFAVAGSKYASQNLDTGVYNSVRG